MAEEKEEEKEGIEWGELMERSRLDSFRECSEVMGFQ
jgi:hypothetical protein